MQLVAVFPAEQQLGHDAVLDHVRRAPLAGDQRVVAEMPPEIVGEVLRAAVDLPAAEHIEALVVEHEDAAGSVAVRRAERADIDAVRAAMHRVRTRVAGCARELVGLDHLDDLAACADPAWCR